MYSVLAPTLPSHFRLTQFVDDMLRGMSLRGHSFSIQPKSNSTPGPVFWGRPMGGVIRPLPYLLAAPHLLRIRLRDICSARQQDGLVAASPVSRKIGEWRTQSGVFIAPGRIAMYRNIDR